MGEEQRRGDSAVRLFIALELPDAARAVIDRRLEPYRSGFPAARWLRPETWHLTLLFLGAVDPEWVGELAQVVEAAAALHGPYGMVTSRGGGRAGPADGVAWLEIAEGARQTIELATWLEHAHPLTPEGEPPRGRRSGPRRTPSAHLTVARRADAALVTALRTRSLGGLDAAWTVERIALVRSHLGPGGSTYETLHRAPLGAPAV